MQFGLGYVDFSKLSPRTVSFYIQIQLQYLSCLDYFVDYSMLYFSTATAYDGPFRSFAYIYNLNIFL